MTRRILALMMGLVLLTGCASSDPLGTSAAGDAGPASKQLVVGSQQYYSNEIIAELFAQALESRGWTIERSYQIGQREVYLPELQAGRIDLMPEYVGNLLQYYDKQATAKATGEITEALREKLPAGLMVLEPAEASDQDSYNVTRTTAEKYGLSSLADLSKVGAVKVAGNSELTKRPYGPAGLKSAYDVDATVLPVEDSGGPLTVKALTDGKVQVADIYSADPSIKAKDLVTLDDPKNLVLPQNVVPVASSRVGADAASVISLVTYRLSTDELIELNRLSVEKQQSSAVIAKQWLAKQGIVPAR
ncbi:osmoprotectant transport system substrate-binding protein [Luteococcus japonicus]|uniref:L-proline glycine betaine binding ABC transporter protein ProX (TC 3.A.1.12.1) n=2 Tax=Luteococcus japonicus TaxID=33984 RepID=A0A1R4KJT2_9ACTN|nr:ABC transporter substrate-binding protein [Luteococcus japonicus]ROR55219.1 osmoprotectant transport system substrate-binding protein [Luteococcus japonicus]SJN44343.1 L-proline glycine betaine binding ABC transporter protein ProX (TC 3.A.1.12.1) [Luteococcus japonicus LSP_Lj1]